MLCYSPLYGHRSETGEITFSKKYAYRDQPIVIRCNRCMPCRIHQTQSWAIRCVHEKHFYDDAIFVSLTYDDDHLPFGGTLIKDELSKFIRRLRDQGHKLRFYGAGEYGDLTKRPHYHALLFNYRPDDAKLHSDQNDIKNYVSETLNKIWGKGFAQFSDITYASAAYCSGYTRKKIYGDMAESHYQTVDPETGEIYTRIPEFSAQSTKPGIGERWFIRFHKDLFPRDYCVINGKKLPVPSYYDRLCEKLYPDLWQQVHTARAKNFFLPISKEITQISEEISITRVGTFSERGKTKIQLYKGSNRQKHCAEIIRNSKNQNRFRDCNQ